MRRKDQSSSDGLGIVFQRYYAGRPRRIAQLGNAIVNDEVGRKIFELRTGAGLTQRQLARMIGTTASVVSRLEDADYRGHSLAMLNRIAAALNARVKIDFELVGARRKSA